MSQSKYVHKTHIHNLLDPQEIVPVLIDLLKPASVIDVGCGIGTFLYEFRNAGVQDIMGVDGEWVDSALREQYLSSNNFNTVDLEKPLELNRTFDLAISLEVAEHLSEESADTFVASLTRLSNTIVFSAAAPRQGGQNHINEQWPKYWIEKFERHGYMVRDILRPLFWENEKIHWWYRQNMMLFVNDNASLSSTLPVVPMTNIIHPDLFSNKAKALDELRHGNARVSTYLTLLYRAVQTRLKNRLNIK